MYKNDMVVEPMSLKGIEFLKNEVYNKDNNEV